MFCHGDVPQARQFFSCCAAGESIYLLYGKVIPNPGRAAAAAAEVDSAEPGGGGVGGAGSGGMAISSQETDGATDESNSHHPSAGNMFRFDLQTHRWREIQCFPEGESFWHLTRVHFN